MWRHLPFRKVLLCSHSTLREVTSSCVSYLDWRESRLLLSRRSRHNYQAWKWDAPGEPKKKIYSFVARYIYIFSILPYMLHLPLCLSPARRGRRLRWRCPVRHQARPAAGELGVPRRSRDRDGSAENAPQQTLSPLSPTRKGKCKDKL